MTLEPIRAGLTRDELASLGLPLARARARRHANGYPLDEAESAALIGLAEAIDRWDEARGPFLSFAGRVIDRKIVEAVREWRWRRQGQPRDDRELSYGDELLALVPDQVSEQDLAETRTDALRALAVLTGLERRVILLRTGGTSLTSCAVELGLSVTQADTIYRRALRLARAELGVGELAA